jgi:cytochrome P450
MADSRLPFNPFEPGFADDPHPAYRQMREIDPVHQNPFGFWVLTGYEDVAAIMRSGMSVNPRGW